MKENITSKSEHLRILRNVIKVKQCGGHKPVPCSGKIYNEGWYDINIVFNSMRHESGSIVVTGY